MKIGIVTYVRCDNYGAELQAFALQYKLNQLGYDAEVINMEKREKDMATSLSSIVPAIVNRFKLKGWKAPYFIGKLCIDVLERKIAAYRNKRKIADKHQLFVSFFDDNIRHSAKYYSLDDIRVATDLKYDVYIAGSDQIWNYMHTDYLDVYFLEFTKKFHSRRISYAACISVPDLPKGKVDEYKKLISNIQYLSVREIFGAQLIKKYTGRDATVVLDPTLLVTPAEWSDKIAKYPVVGKKYILIYTLSGSKYIHRLAKYIAEQLGCAIVNIKSNFRKEPEDGTIHLYNLGPSEWVGLMMKASYVVTDSFHGTAFSINFNIPFTTLVNPNGNTNTRVLSILEITHLKERIIYDDSNALPSSLDINFSPVNSIIEEWRNKSLNFLINSLAH